MRALAFVAAQRTIFVLLRWKGLPPKSNQNNFNNKKSDLPKKNIPLNKVPLADRNKHKGPSPLLRGLLEKISKGEKSPSNKDNFFKKLITILHLFLFYQLINIVHLYGLTERYCSHNAKPCSLSVSTTNL